MLVTALIVLNTMLLGALIIILFTFKAAIPDIQQVLDDVGASISEQMAQIFEKPSVSRAMSVLGKESGSKRASAALKNKVAEKALGSNILAKKALEYLDITPLEGFELMNDPTFGPVIRNMIGGFSKGLGGLGGSNSPGIRTRGRGQVPNMS